VIEEIKRNSHPNVLPIIEAETPFPFCIMSPWMEGGSITQYIEMNQGVNRLVLVRARHLEINEDTVPTTHTTARSSLQRSNVPSRVIYFTRRHRSGGQNKKTSEPAR